MHVAFKPAQTPIPFSLVTFGHVYVTGLVDRPQNGYYPFNYKWSSHEKHTKTTFDIHLQKRKRRRFSRCLTSKIPAKNKTVPDSSQGPFFILAHA